MKDDHDRGVYRGVYSSLIDDADFQRLSPAARHVLLTLRLCSQNTVASIFRFYEPVLLAQTGYGSRVLRTCLAELQAQGWTELQDVVVWIRNGLRYDPSIRLTDPKHRKAVLRAVHALPKLPIVLRFCDYYKIARPFEGPSEPLGRPSEGVSSPIPTPTPIPTPPAPPEGGRRKRDPHAQAVIDAWYERFREKFGSPPAVNGAKAYALAKALVRGRPAEEALWLVREFLDHPPDFYAEKNLFGLEHVLSASTQLLARRGSEPEPPRPGPAFPPRGR